MNTNPAHSHESQLRWALLASLGLASLACGGSTLGDPSPTSGGSTSQNGGSDNRGGSSSQGGFPNRGGSTNQGGSTSQGGGSPVSACTSPQTDPITGLVTCKEGYTHRPVAKQCGIAATDAAPSGAAPDPLPRADGSVACSAEDEAICDAYQFGYCNLLQEGGGLQFSSCRSGCIADADCGADQACICGSRESPTGGSCRYVRCRTDQDCGAGSLCASVGQTCGAGTYACQSAADECKTDADCGGGVSCVYGESGDGTPRRQCGSGAVCGRPFLVEAQPRLAPIVNGGDWLERDATLPSVEQLTSAERSALAEHWAYLGQMEHASIAAFARFSLQLLSLGAPPELVDACTQALADETAHTKLCFRIASAYAGRALGPGPLDVQRSLELSSLADIVELVIIEGCFGETSAALDALQAADNASDPVIASAYARIAADEQRHAELAFRFVRWALERGGEAVRARVLAASNGPAPSRAARQVARPCLATLLDATRAFSAPARAAS